MDAKLLNGTQSSPKPKKERGAKNSAPRKKNLEEILTSPLSKRSAARRKASVGSKQLGVGSSDDFLLMSGDAGEYENNPR